MTGLSFWIVIASDFSELGEYFGDDYLKLVKTFWVDLRNPINNNDRIDAIRYFGPLLQYVAEQL